MDFRQQKLRLALCILAAGMAVALLYHGVEGWVLGKGYPDNTFLFPTRARFSDFTDCLTDTADPYKTRTGLNVYFPATYLLFGLFSPLPPHLATFIFLTVSVLGLCLLANPVLRPVVPSFGRRILAGLIFFLSYPVIYCLDRANIEILLVFFVGLSLYFYSRRLYGPSLFALLPAICLKLYPAVLLLLFLRRKQVRWIAIGALGFILISWLTLLTFKSPFLTSCLNFTKQLHGYNKSFAFEPQGISRSASAWSLFRLGIWSVYCAAHGRFVWPMPWFLDRVALAAYSLLAAAGFAFLALYILLVETAFARKAVLLLLYLTMSAPAGGDYKLLHVLVALIILILVPARRRWDLAAIGLLAFALVPKREIIFTFLGASDSLYPDASIAIVLNPLCLLTVMALLMLDGWQLTNARLLRLRLEKFKGIFRRPRPRPAFPPAA